MLWGSLALQAATYRETVLADHPAAYYRLEEAPGAATAVDSSANGAFPGAYTISADGLYPALEQPGIEVNSGYFKSVPDESGTMQYSLVEVPYSAELNPSGAFSADVWVRALSFSADSRCPFGSFGGWGGGAPGWFFYQPGASDGTAHWALVMKGGGIWLQMPANVVKNDWYHLAMTYDGTTLKFYVNGEAVSSTALSDYAPNPAEPVTIGGSRAGGWGFDGSVDEAAIYLTALTPEQIATHYEVGRNSFRVVTVPPTLTSNPANVTVYAGRTAKFVVGVDGTAPFSYQWYKGTTAIEGATSDTLVLTPTSTDSGSTYYATVSNALGSVTSQVATLTVNTDLVLSASPVSITRNVGSVAGFAADIAGALPITGYQWMKDGAAIAGATNRMLWLTNVQTSLDASTYTVRVSNPWTSIDSEAATLTVVARETTVPMTGYAATVLKDGPIAYWRLNEAAGSPAAVDAIGSFNGTFDSAKEGAVFTYHSATGVPKETDTALSVSGGGRVAVPYAVELNPQGPFTAEAWIKPASLGAISDDYRTPFSALSSDGPTGWLLYQQPNHTFALVLFPGSWNTVWMYDTDDTIVAGNWYHFVLTRDSDNLFSMYVNGVLRASTVFADYVPSRPGGAVNFGWRADGGFNPFDGAIDEVAFYNKALTAEQVVNHYGAPPKVSISLTGATVTVTWPSGTLQESGTIDGTFTDVAGATSPATITVTGAAKFYRVKQ